MMTTGDPASRARLAYTAYGKALGWSDRAGRELPVFDALPAQDRAAWVAAADALGPWCQAAVGPDSSGHTHTCTRQPHPWVESLMHDCPCSATWATQADVDRLTAGPTRSQQ